MNCVLYGNLKLSVFEMYNRVYDPNGLCPALKTMQGGNLQPKIVVYEHKDK